MEKTSMEKTNIRKSNIELLRIAGMLMIVAHHYVINSGIMDAYETGSTAANYVFLTLWGMWGKTGINVFILISGYFMCTASLTIRRYCRILFEWILYHFGIYIILLTAGYETVGLNRLFDLFFGIFRYANMSGAFDSSFFIFYLFIPFMNVFIRGVTKAEYKKFIIYLIFVFTILSTVFFNKAVFGEIFWFVAVYFIGAYLRLYPPVWSNSFKASGRLLIMSLVFAYASVIFMIIVGAAIKKGSAVYFLYDANKPGAVLVSIMLFAAFKNLNIGYSKVINLIAKTTFGVLLIHANSGAWRQFMWRDLLHVDTFYSLPLYVLVFRSVLITAGVFVACSLIDMVRITLIEKPMLNHFESIERVIKKIWVVLLGVSCSVYKRIVTLADR